MSFPLFTLKRNHFSETFSFVFSSLLPTTPTPEGMASNEVNGKAPFGEKVVYIEIRDMKNRYKILKNQKQRINAFIRALEMNYLGLKISFCIKEHNIAEFILKGETVSREDKEFIKEYLYGEFCAPENNKKYRPSKKASQRAWEGITTDTQRDRQISASPSLTIQAMEDHDVKMGTGPTELRQFACLPCNRKWWRTVLKNKTVSRCRGDFCHYQRYDALPKEKEFGIGRFLCPNQSCKREFYGYCEATDIKKCRKCGTDAKPYIHPKWIKRSRKKQQQRKLNPNAQTFRPASPARPKDAGPVFYPISELGGNLPPMEDLHLGSPPPPYTATSPLVPPTSYKRRIFNPSLPHISTGSTISTFISQCDFDRNGIEVDLDYDPEVDDAAVGACSFKCSCNNEFTVLCRMMDQAECFQCHSLISPLHWAPPRELEHRTNSPHSCSRCQPNGECPNLQEARFARM